MTTIPQFAATLGVAAVVVWATLGFGWALLALLAAALFATIALILTGTLSPTELRDRLDGARSGFAAPRRR
jgi:hypothetical protein